MATKEISQLPSTNVSNDTDLLMTRQGSQDRAVQVQTVRNVGNEPGQNLGVGSYGTGGDAISITSIYASNNANLIDRGGVYAVNGTTNVPVAQGELHHSQLSSTSATQTVKGENQESYWRKKVGGTWLAWVLDSAANKETVRTDLGVPSNAQALLVANNLQEIEDAGAAAQETARGNLGVGAAIDDFFENPTLVFSGASTSVDLDTDTVEGVYPGDGLYYVTGAVSGIRDGAFIYHKDGQTGKQVFEVALTGSNLRIYQVEINSAETTTLSFFDQGAASASSLTIRQIYKFGSVAS